jgi:hypothetical protein
MHTGAWSEELQRRIYNSLSSIDDDLPGEWSERLAANLPQPFQPVSGVAGPCFTDLGQSEAGDMRAATIGMVVLPVARRRREQSGVSDPLRACSRRPAESDWCRAEHVHQP